ncbi:hypothetical protein DEAC_c02640 [Desulfosporosinus acididurans]|uniref:Lipoprotein n=1 Tax=Desulfosporosinus acididurans TaxID=476652 RepID=A0A0J1FX13_9FIRM|nr:hypothetical protein [Desulfosporosinus acididurans]KLU67857.1 hypothetical protein DEAC_c02640 [Desulfosporosinus acididurans]
MKRKKIVIWFALAMMLLLVLTGCSSNEQEIFNAALNMQTINSSHIQTTMNLHVSGQGFDPQVQQQIDSVAALLNNASLNFDVESTYNDQKTVGKSKAIVDVVTPGMKINIPVWVDSDLTGDTPSIKEIVKLPLIAKSSLPQLAANKDYLVMNPLDTKDSGLDNESLKQLLEFSKTFQEKEIDFLKSYASRFNPNFSTVANSTESISTDDGYKLVRCYEIRLNDQQFKDLIRYTVNNFSQDKEAMDFVKDLVHSTLQMSQAPDKEKSIQAFDQAFEQFDASKTVFLATFNSQMDKLKNVTLLGDKGIDLKYYIDNGYVIKESGTIDLKIDLNQLNQFMSTIDNKSSASDTPKGSLEMILNYNSDISGTNSPIEIQIPEVNAANSFNMTDLLKMEQKSN